MFIEVTVSDIGGGHHDEYINVVHIQRVYVSKGMTMIQFSRPDTPDFPVNDSYYKIMKDIEGVLGHEEINVLPIDLNNLVRPRSNRVSADES